MNSVLFTIALIGIAGLLVQSMVCLFAVRGLRARTDYWTGEAKLGRYRRQTREAAISELERQLALLPTSISLRRLGVMAPLLGVVLTTGSIVFGETAARLGTDGGGVGDLRGMLRELSPLLAGVSVGAVLAIVNQFLSIVLHRVEYECLGKALLDVQDCTFRDTDDRLDLITDQIGAAGKALDVVTRHLDQAVRVSTESVERLTATITSAANQLKSVTTDLRGTLEIPASAFAESASEFTESARAVGSDFRGLSKALEMMHKTGIERLESIQTMHAEAIQTQIRAVQGLSGDLRKLGDMHVGAFEASLQSAADSTGRLGQGIEQALALMAQSSVRIDEQIVHSCGTIVGSFARLQALLTEAEGNWRACNARLVSAAPTAEEAAKLRDSIRQFAELMTSAALDIRDLVLMPDPVADSNSRGHLGRLGSDA
jgi:hypothetical protein